MFDAVLDNLPDVDDVWEPSAADIAEYLSWSTDHIPDPDDAAPDALSTAMSLHRLSAAAEAQEMEALAAFARETMRTGPGDRGFRGTAISEYVIDEVSCAFSITRRAAELRVALALRLTESLPATLSAWKAGDLDASKVAIIANRTVVLRREQAGLVEDHVLAHAVGKTTGQWRRIVDRAVIAVDPDGANARHEKARQERSVQHVPGPDGMGTIKATLSAEDAVLVYATLSLIARSFPTTDPRTMDQRRADTLVDLITGRVAAPTSETSPAQGNGGADAECIGGRGYGGSSGHTGDPDSDTDRSDAEAGNAPTQSARRPGKPLINLIITAGTVLGLDNQPAELSGYGPIPADLARRIAADGTWRRILTDPVSGTILDYGRTTNRPPAALADYVRARDRVCRFPTCQRPAAQCGIDHKKPYPQGETNPDNLWTLCRRHRRLKDHHTGWTVTGNPNEKVTWTSPTGRRYESCPHRYRDEHPMPASPPERPPVEIPDPTESPPF